MTEENTRKRPPITIRGLLVFVTGFAVTLAVASAVGRPGTYTGDELVICGWTTILLIWPIGYWYAGRSGVKVAVLVSVANYGVLWMLAPLM